MGLDFIVFLLSSFAIVSIDVAVLAHAVGVEFPMGAVPRLFGPSVLVVAIAAHAFSVVLFVGVAAAVHFFSS